MTPRPLTRREFLEVAAALGAGTLLSACAPGPGGDRSMPAGTPAAPTADTGPFTAAERRNLEAATARLIPTDDLPGAREAGVVGFIERQLAVPQLAAFLGELRTGAAALDVVARARFGRPFAPLDEDGQDAVLLALERDEGSSAGFSARHFFAVLLALTLEGFLSDPAHGGNLHEAGWKAIGWSPRNPWLHGGHHG